MSRNAKALGRFLDAVPGLKSEIDPLIGRERELLDEFASELVDATNGCAVRDDLLGSYVDGEVDLFSGELSPRDKQRLRGLLRKMIDAEYERIRSRRPKTDVENNRQEGGQ
jgi:hypothetical protein